MPMTSPAGLSTTTTQLRAAPCHSRSSTTALKCGALADSTGITPESLKHTHPSVQRNPIIAEVFYRAGLIEKWGRGTNRVAAMRTTRLASLHRTSPRSRERPS